MESKNKVLFVGHTYIDVTFLTNRMPEGDEKYVAEDYAFSFGGNAVVAAFCCAKLGFETDLLCAFANDRPGRMFQSMAIDYPLQIYQRKVANTAVSFIRPFQGKRAILRGRDAHYLRAFPVLDLSDFLALHLDGHQPDAALYYAMECRKRGILTSLDGGRLRANTDELLKFIDVAVVSELLCEQMGLNPSAMLDYLRDKGCKVGAVTLGSEGVLWYAGDRNGHLAAYPVAPEKSSTPMAQATSFTAPICFPICAIPNSVGKTISTSPRLPPRSRSSIWGSKPAFRHWPASRRRCAMRRADDAGRFRNLGIDNYSSPAPWPDFSAHILFKSPVTIAVLDWPHPGSFAGGGLWRETISIRGDASFGNYRPSGRHADGRLCRFGKQRV